MIMMCIYDLLASTSAVPRHGTLVQGIMPTPAISTVSGKIGRTYHSSNMFAIQNSIYIYYPAPGLPRVCFGIFLRVFMMTFMFISGYLQDF